MIITVGGTKGGVGKTTALVNLAVELQARGFKPVIFDIDPEGQATLWATMREQAGLPTIPCYQLNYADPNYSESSIAERVLDLDDEYEVVLVDVAGRASSEQLRSIAASDMLILATRPGLFEFNSLQNLEDDLQAVYAANPEIDIRVLITHAFTHLGDARTPEFMKMIGDTFDNYSVLTSQLATRAVYADANSKGTGVSEEANVKAAREMRRVYEELFSEYLQAEVK